MMTWKLSAFCALSLALAGCTVAPPLVRSAGPSLDAGLPTSGILAVLPGHHYIVTPLFGERYADLVRRYGDRLIPPMKTPRWIESSGTNYIITSDGLAAFATLDFYARQKQGP